MLLQTSAAVADLCARLQASPYLTVDTEFLSEKRYRPQLCLLQLGAPGLAAAIDPLVPGLDLRPVAALLADASLLKVFHAGRQDLAIFQHLFGALPVSVADTQVMASVCGFGDQAGYATLCESVIGVTIDKTNQATDWSLRPLTESQVAYALGDVVHLCDLYEALRARVDGLGRADWVAQEHVALQDPRTFARDPEEAWRKIRVRRPSPRTTAIVRALAAWRERTAAHRDTPAGWVLHDDAIVEIAEQLPANAADLARVRRVTPAFAKGRDGEAVLRQVRHVLDAGEQAWPVAEVAPKASLSEQALMSLLQALLRLRADTHGVGSALVTSQDELVSLTRGQRADLPVLDGWRADVFGNDALALLNGTLWLTGGPDGLVEHRAPRGG